MKICIFGAGAIGGYLGAELGAAGFEVVLIARGAHLEAMKAKGLSIVSGGRTRTFHPNCTGDPAEAGVQDVVILTLKAHSVPEASQRMAPLLGPDTAVVTAANGVPWWYFYRLEGPWENHRIESVDPGNRQWDLIGPERAIGCVLYPAALIVEPGVIEVVPDATLKRLPIGEPDGSKSDRCRALSQALVKAGFKAPVRADIRTDIWVKLWGNMAFNPVSVLTHATLEDIARDPGMRTLCRAMMLEARAIAERLGVEMPIDLDRRIAGAEKVGPHKTSMLQDLEHGRPMEIDALVTAVAELGRLVGVETPFIDAVLALVKARARAAGGSPR